MFEMTSQLLFLLPVLVSYFSHTEPDRLHIQIGVLISNAVASYLAPSIYDSIIRLKHLPYLPDIKRAESV